MIKIMADSTCDLSAEIIERYQIGVAPLTITIEGKVYRDKIDLTSDQFFEQLPKLKDLPTTGAPSPASYLSIMEEAVAEGCTEILCICMSSGTSASYESAEVAKGLFHEEHGASDIKIHVVDSWSMSHGSGWLIMKSAQLLEEGWTFDELVAFNESHKRRVKHFLCVDDLNNLIKGGRLSNTEALIGKLLRVKPIMSMKDTKGAVVAKVRGTNNSLKYYVDEFSKRCDRELSNFIIIGYSSNRGLAERLQDRIESQTDFTGDIYIMQMGAAVGTHVGLGGLSLFFMEKENV